MFKVALLNPFPNQSFTAERECIKRIQIACWNLGWECVEAITSDDALSAEPDCVLAMHECTPKLTHLPTIGLAWNPPDFHQNDPVRTRNLLTYDGYLAGSESVRQYIGDLLFSTGKRTPISDWNFLPTSPSTEYQEVNLASPALFYIGVHWDRDRHANLIPSLAASLPLHLYGDPQSLSVYGDCYKGRIPFDGVSVFREIRKAGIALCLHRPEHLRCETPSMRVFEAAAAGAVIITEDSRFFRTHFGESLLYIDAQEKLASRVEQIASHYQWILSHPDKAAAMASAAHGIFQRKFALEASLSNLPDFVGKVRKQMQQGPSGNVQDHASIEVIVRVGSRDVGYIKRSLDSLANQTYSNLCVTLVAFRPVQGLEALVRAYAIKFKSIRLIAAPDTGFRSTALWTALQHLQADYFCMLDDDDSLHPNHLASLARKLEQQEDAGVAYSGVIQVQDEPGHYYRQWNFEGDLSEPIKELRSLIFFEPFRGDKLARLDNYLTSNCWLARSQLIRSDDLEDPKLVVGEDVMLLLMFLSRTAFAFTWRPTACWHWRSSSRDNSGFDDEVHRHESLTRILQRSRFYWLSHKYPVLQAPSNVESHPADVTF